MSKINELINKLCPDGVRYNKLSEIGNQFSGLSGKSKKDFENGNCKYITYTNIYNNPSTNLDVEDYVQVKENEKQNEIKYKDILVAGSSENLEDSGMISVVTKEPNEKIYLNSFCFGFRLNDIFYDKYNPDFLKHLFRDKNFRNEIISCSFGVTRYNLSKEKFLKIKIPCPPLEIQEEIVRILDKFGELEAELEEELEARKSQYEFWRTNLLNNYKELKTVKDVLIKYCSGATPLKGNAAFYEGGTIPWLRTQEVRFNEINHTECFVTEVALEKTGIKFIPENCVIVAMSGASAGRCAINKIPLTTNQHCLNLEVDPNKANYKYVYYCICNAYGELLSKKEGARGDLNSSKIVNLKIPMPSLEIQNKIVSVLDKFDKLINDIAVGLPAEIELRRKQYEYYRNKLLSFKEI